MRAPVLFTRRGAPARLQAVCFLRPTRENVTMLKRELRQPRFQSYHFCECVPQQGPGASLAKCSIECCLTEASSQSRLMRLQTHH